MIAPRKHPSNKYLFSNKYLVWVLECANSSSTNTLKHSCEAKFLTLQIKDDTYLLVEVSGRRILHLGFHQLADDIRLVIGALRVPEGCLQRRSSARHVLTNQSVRSGRRPRSRKEHVLANDLQRLWTQWENGTRLLSHLFGKVSYHNLV